MRKIVRIESREQLRFLLEALCEEDTDVSESRLKKFLGAACAAGAIGCAGTQAQKTEVPMSDPTHARDQMPGDYSFDWETPEERQPAEDELATGLPTAQRHAPGLKAYRKYGPAKR